MPLNSKSIRGSKIMSDSNNWQHAQRDCHSKNWSASVSVTLKAHLAMAQPQTIEELLKLPLIVNEVVDEPLYTMMQLLTIHVDTMEANAKKQDKFQSRSLSPAAVNRSRCPSPAAQRCVTLVYCDLQARRLPGTDVIGCIMGLIQDNGLTIQDNGLARPGGKGMGLGLLVRDNGLAPP